MRIATLLLALAAGVAADSSRVVSEKTIMNRIITSLLMFDKNLKNYKGGDPTAIKNAAGDLAHTIEAQTVIAHEIGTLSHQEASELEGKTQELHETGGQFLKDFADAKKKLDEAGASPKVYYYLTFKLSKPAS